MQKYISIIFLLISFFIINSCGIYKKTDSRNVPVNAQERARKNVNEGSGISLKGIIGNRGTNFEFSSSNPMWRASLETLNFLPLANVDYSGGIIISDWYSDSTEINESIKISLRFLSNEIRSDSLQIVIFKKKCTTNNNCQVTSIESKIKEELLRTILAKAKELEVSQKSEK